MTFRLPILICLLKLYKREHSILAQSTTWTIQKQWVDLSIKMTVFVQDWWHYWENVILIRLQLIVKIHLSLQLLLVFKAKILIIQFALTLIAKQVNWCTTQGPLMFSRMLITWTSPKKITTNNKVTAEAISLSNSKQSQTCLFKTSFCWQTLLGRAN